MLIWSTPWLSTSKEGREPDQQHPPVHKPMYLLGTLKRFSEMPRQEIIALAQEIALLGQNGLDYASPDKKYSVSAFLGEKFSGLQLLCFMYVGFKQIDPSLDTGLDFGDAYKTATELFENPPQ